MRARDLTLAGCLAGAWLLTGCSGDADGPRAEATRTVTATATATVTAPATSPATSPATGTPVTVRLGEEGARYVETPSRNIRCFLLAYGHDRRVECTVQSREFADPPAPEACDLDWVPQFTLAAEASYGACRGDVNDPLPAVVLEYGTVAVNGPIRCTSQETGLTCRNEDTDHGFSVNRGGYELF